MRKGDEKMTGIEKPEFPYPVIELDRVPYTNEITAVTERIKQRTGKGLGIARHTDYRRWAYVQELISTPDSLLDVGVGAGQFINATAMSGQIPKIVGADIAVHSSFERYVDNYDFVISNITDFSCFEDNEFSATVCMEVVEHLPDGIMEKGIEQLRRVTKEKLYMSVPFEEPEPIYHGHYQRYTQERLEKLFPDAEIALMYSRKAAAVSPGYCPIALIIESF